METDIKEPGQSQGIYITRGCPILHPPEKTWFQGEHILWRAHSTAGVG